MPTSTRSTPAPTPNDFDFLKNYKINENSRQVLLAACETFENFLTYPFEETIKWCPKLTRCDVSILEFVYYMHHLRGWENKEYAEYKFNQLQVIKELTQLRTEYKELTEPPESKPSIIVNPVVNLPTPASPPPKYVQIKDLTKLLPHHIYTDKFLQNVHLKCRNLASFHTFYTSLKQQGSRYNIYLRDLDDITQTALSLPNVPYETAKDLQSAMFTFLSKEGTFHSDFKEGQDALETNINGNGYDILDVLLMQTHAKLSDTWSCERDKPKYSDFNNLSKYCVAVNEYITLEEQCNRLYAEEEKSRMYISRLDAPEIQHVKHDLMSKLVRGNRPENSLLLKNLPSTVAKHRLFPSSIVTNITTPSSNPTNTPNAIVAHNNNYEDRINHLYDQGENIVNYGSARANPNYH